MNPGGGEIGAEHDPLAAPFGDGLPVLRPPDMAPDERARDRRHLAGEMPDPARGAVDQHLAAEQQAALAQHVQGGQPGDRQGRRRGIADRIGQDRHRMGAAGHPLSPGARRQRTQAG